MCSNYILKDILLSLFRNPCIQLFYCILVAGGTGVLTFNILSYFDSFNMYCTTAYILITISFTLFTICSYRDPGVVTKDNVSNFLGIYEPDGLFYLEQQCNTCDIVKPARSKHCCKLKKIFFKFFSVFYLHLMV